MYFSRGMVWEFRVFILCFTTSHAMSHLCTRGKLPKMICHLRCIPEKFPEGRRLRHLAATAVFITVVKPFNFQQIILQYAVQRSECTKCTGTMDRKYFIKIQLSSFIATK